MRLAPAAALLLGALTAPALAAPNHLDGRFVEVLGQRLWVEVAGEGEPLIVVAGGGGGSHDYFHPWLDELARSFRLVYYDAFGRGRSPRARDADEYSFDRDVREVEALRVALGLGRAHVLGHSFGGFTAQAWALRHPESVRSLLLLNTFLAVGRDYQTSNDRLNARIADHLPELWRKVEELRAGGLKARAPELQQAYFGAFNTMLELFYLRDPGLSRHLPLDESTFNPEVYYRLVGDDADFVIGGDVAGLDFTRPLSAARFPILVLAGRHDGVVLPVLADTFRTLVPRARFVMMERSGHFPFIEEPEATRGAIVDFARR